MTLEDLNRALGYLKSNYEGRTLELLEGPDSIKAGMRLRNLDTYLTRVLNEGRFHSEPVFGLYFRLGVLVDRITQERDWKGYVPVFENGLACVKLPLTPS